MHGTFRPLTVEMFRQSQNLSQGSSLLSFSTVKCQKKNLFEYYEIDFLGGDVYVLQINEVKHNDTGLYICEVNTEPPLRSFHRLSVLTDKLVAPPKRTDL